MAVLQQHAYDNAEVVFPPGVSLDVRVMVFGEPKGGMPERDLGEKGESYRASYNRVKHLLRPGTTSGSDDLMDKVLVSGGAMVTFTMQEPVEA